MRLSAREQALVILVGGTVFVLMNMVLLSAFVKKNAALRQDLELRKGEWAEMEEELGNGDMWEKRDEALTLKQPKLVNQNAAEVELLDQINSVAKAHNVTLDNKVLGVVAVNKGYKSVPVTLQTHSTWPDLVAFLYALQKPDKFIVCEKVKLDQDPSDAAKMEGDFTIARWYAP